MKEYKVKAFEVTSSYYSIGSHDEKREKNKELSNMRILITYLVNDSGFVYAEQNGPKKDSMIFSVYQPLAQNPSTWIATDDSMVIDSSEIRLYHRFFEDKRIRLAKKYNLQGQLLYQASYFPGRGNKESLFYYTGTQLDSIRTSPGSFYSDELKVYIYDDYNGKLKQKLTYSVYNDHEGKQGSNRLSSIASYHYAKGKGDGSNGLLQEVVTITPLTEGIYWRVDAFKWYSR